MEVLYDALSFDDFLFAGMFPFTGEVDMRGLFPLVEGETLPPDLALGFRAVATQRENTACFLKRCSFAISLRFGGLCRPWPDSRSSSRRPLPTFAAHSKFVCCRQDHQDKGERLTAVTGQLFEDTLTTYHQPGVSGEVVGIPLHTRWPSSSSGTNTVWTSPAVCS